VPVKALRCQQSKHADYKDRERAHHKHPRNHECTRIRSERLVHIIISVNMHQSNHHRQGHKPYGHNKIAKHPVSYEK